MEHRAATDEICVKRGMGKSPSSSRRELIRVPACCLLAPKGLACPCKQPEKAATVWDATMMKFINSDGLLQGKSKRIFCI